MEPDTRRRGSKQREAVAEAVRSLANHPTADQVFMKVRDGFSRISLSTVYRNLGILVEEGELVAVTGPGGELHYDHTLEDHSHALCERCGRVHDVHVSPGILSAARKVDVPGFEIEDVMVTFKGICSECRERKGKEHGA